jgi:hypothetical protein
LLFSKISGVRVIRVLSFIRVYQCSSVVEFLPWLRSAAPNPEFISRVRGLKPTSPGLDQDYRKRIMSSTYVIRWKSKENGRAGRGTKCFERSEAERLAQELNSEYPQIEHEAVKMTPQIAEQSSTEDKPEDKTVAFTE